MTRQSRWRAAPIGERADSGERMKTGVCESTRTSEQASEDERFWREPSLPR